MNRISGGFEADRGQGEKKGSGKKGKGYFQKTGSLGAIMQPGSEFYHSPIVKLINHKSYRYYTDIQLTRLFILEGAIAFAVVHSECGCFDIKYIS